MWRHKTNIVVVPDALVQHCVLLYLRQVKQPRTVNVRALWRTEHVRTVVQHKHVSVVIIHRLAVRLQAIRVRGAVDSGVNVLVVQKVLHAMRGTTNLGMHAFAQPYVHRLPIVKHPAAPRIVLMIAQVLLPTPHPRRILEHARTPTHAAAIIQLVIVNRRARHVRDVLRGHAPAPAPVAVVHVH